MILKDGEMQVTSKERVFRTLDFDSPDRIPVDIWTLPIVDKVFGSALTDMVQERDIDIFKIPLFDPVMDEHAYEIGRHTDMWGTEWLKLQEGIIGEPKKCPLADLDAAQIKQYKSPVSILKEHRLEIIGSAAPFVKENSNKFLISGWCGIFERMQFLRGVENLYCDIALETDEFFAVRDIAMEYAIESSKIYSIVEGADGCIVGDDWGSQLSLLISPEAWRKLFKPCYQQLIDIIKSNGKRVFIHSDGYILDIYEDWIEMGADAINSQIWCMGVENVAAATRSRITLWGELSRQEIMPHGTPDDVQRAIDTMKKHLWNNGGLIGQFEVNKDVPLENIKVGLFGW